LRISQQFISDEAGDGYYTMENFTPINNATFSLVPKTQKTSAGTQFANALKGSASGEVVALKDVSPLEHGLGVRVSSKNLFDGVWESGIISGTNGANVAVDGYTRAKNYIPVVYGEKYVFSNGVDNSVSALVYEYTEGFAYNLTNNIVVNANSVYTPSKATTKFIRFRFNTKTFPLDTTAQLEKGTTATAYTPFVPDVGAVKLRAQGVNIIDITEMLNNQLVDNGDGTYTFTKNGESGLRFANWANINIPKSTKVAVNIDFIEIGLEPIESVLTIQFMTDDENTDTTIGLAPENIPRSFYFSTKNLTKARFCLSSKNKDGEYVKFKNFQLEYGTAATEYEPYIEPVEYAVNADGTVEGVKSIYPAITLTTDTVGALIEVDYNRDINKAFAELQQAIISLGGNV
jgi:hypothetical protein